MNAIDFSRVLDADTERKRALAKIYSLLLKLAEENKPVEVLVMSERKTFENVSDTGVDYEEKY